MENITRRNFVKNGLLTLVGSAVFPACEKASNIAKEFASKEMRKEQDKNNKILEKHVKGIRKVRSETGKYLAHYAREDIIQNPELAEMWKQEIGPYEIAHFYKKFNDNKEPRAGEIYHLPEWNFEKTYSKN